MIFYWRDKEVDRVSKNQINLDGYILNGVEFILEFSLMINTKIILADNKPNKDSFEGNMREN